MRFYVKWNVFWLKEVVIIVYIFFFVLQVFVEVFGEIVLCKIGFFEDVYSVVLLQDVYEGQFFFNGIIFKDVFVYSVYAFEINQLLKSV